ncbi:MAG: hypothetical protein ACP5O8_01370 [Candidatus Aenigmatarchaeota archaeon]
MRNKLLIIPIILAILMAFFPGYSEPKKFVENMTYEKTSSLLFTYEVTSYPSKVEIILPEEEKIRIGLVADFWNLNFGIIPTGGSYGRRQVSISNFENTQVRVYFKVYGSIRPLVGFSKNDFVLLPGQAETVTVFLNTTKETIPGNYSGQIDVIVKKPNFSFILV